MKKLLQTKAPPKSPLTPTKAALPGLTSDIEDFKVLSDTSHPAKVQELSSRVMVHPRMTYTIFAVVEESRRACISGK